LKLFQEWDSFPFQDGEGDIKENGGGGEFKYEIFDIL
jgi:hypothetical protein